jgi:hypothetical protein
VSMSATSQSFAPGKLLSIHARAYTTQFFSVYPSPPQLLTPAHAHPLAMAFAPVLPVSARAAPGLRCSATDPLRPATAAASATRMGYGDYSYSTDKTKGHVQQYYVDKFRVVGDFVRGTPRSDADAMLGRSAKGGVLVPKGGVPQPVDPILLADVTGVPEDPRIAESEGSTWEWDSGYLNPEFAASTYADVDDEEVSARAFAAFRTASSAERGAVLGELDAALKFRVEKILDGFSEEYMLTLEGQHEANYARLQHIKDVVMFTPDGQPWASIPGFPYLPPVGAMDFMPISVNKSWKTLASPGSTEAVYPKPIGAIAPKLP